MRTSLALVPAVALAVVLGFACGGSTSTPTPPNTTPSNVPCDVAAVLAKCASCHGSPTAGGAPMTLLSADDLKAPAASDSTKTNAEVSVARMNAGTMPPGGGAQADAAVLQAWITAGYPAGTCTTDQDAAPPSEYPGPAQCTKGAGTTKRGSTMRPGENCLQSGCHAGDFVIAGTLFPTGREKNDCNGVAGGATVKVTDANSKLYSLPVNSAGNFYLSRFSALGFKTPYTVEVVVGSDSRKMLTPQTDGGCNSCHAEPPSGGAPGRVVVPGWTP